MKHWSAPYVGLAADDVVFRGAPSPCWETCRHPFYRERGELLSPLSAGNGWRKINPEEAEDFDLVLFAQGGIDAHVGLIAGGPGRMLHMPEGGRSVVERFDNGSFMPRLKGIYRRDANVGFSAPTGWSGKPTFDPGAGVTVIAAPFINPDEDCTLLQMQPGQSLGQIVEGLFPRSSADQRSRFMVRVGSPGLPLAEWTTFPMEAWAVRPRAGRVVLVEPLPGLSFGQIVGLLATVAAMATGQFYLGPLLAGAVGATGITSQIIVGATTLALTTGVALALGALFKPQSDADKPVYAATGWENQAKPNAPVPIPAGKTRDAPPYAAPPYISLARLPNGEDVIELHGLFIEMIGKGVITKRRFGDTFIEKFKEIDEGEDGERVPITVEEAYIEPGDPWPFTVYDHQVIPVDPSTMGATFENGADGGTEDDWIEREAPTGCNDLEVILVFPAGQYNTSNNGSLRGNSVYINLEYAPIDTEDWVAVNWTELRGGKRSTFYVGRKWEVDPAVAYKVRFRKNGKDDDFDIDSSQDAMQWMALQGHRPLTPFKCRAAVTATAFKVLSTDQLQGTLKAYNRVASRVCLDWDAEEEEWVERETQNPFSYARYRLQCEVLANPYADADLDLEQFRAAHEYADAKGLSFNSVGAGDRPLLDEVNEACQAGRGRARRYNGPWGLVIDRPRSVVIGHITPADGWDISVSTRRTPDADSWRVTFSCETRDYVTRTRVVPFPGVVTPVKPLDLALPGVTHPDQVYREAIRAYYRDFVYRLPEYVASTHWQHLTFDPAEGVLLIDDGLTRSRLSTLAVSVDENNVMQIAAPYTMEAGKNYRIRFRHLPAEEDEGADPPPAVWLTRNVKTVVGPQNALFLIGSGVAPARDDVVVISEVGDDLQEVIVERIERGDEYTGRLILRPHAPEIEALVDALVVPAFTGAVGDPVADVTGAPPVPIITEIRSSQAAGGSGVDVFVNGGPGVGGGGGGRAPATLSIDVEHRLQGAPGWNVVSIPGASGRAEFGGYVDDDVIEVRAKAIGATAESAYCAIVEHVYGLADLYPPDNIVAEYVFDEVAGNLVPRILVTWDPGKPGDFFEVQWQVQAGGALSTLVTEADATEAITLFVSESESHRVRVRAARSDGEGQPQEESAWSAWVNVPDVILAMADDDTFMLVDDNTLRAAA